MVFATADGSPPPSPADGLSLFTVPGLNGSGPQHWQTEWERLRPEIVRVEQRNWAKPDLEEWSKRVEHAIAASAHQVVLIAHSFGCLVSVHAAHVLPAKVAGLMLVAPADPDKFGISHRVPARPLASSALLVGSTNDPWLTAARARGLARTWGTRYTELQGAGHINAEAGFGLWPAGLRLLDEQLAIIQALRCTARAPSSA